MRHEDRRRKAPCTLLLKASKRCKPFRPKTILKQSELSRVPQTRYGDAGPEAPMGAKQKRASCVTSILGLLEETTNVFRAKVENLCSRLHLSTEHRCLAAPSESHWKLAT